MKALKHKGVFILIYAPRDKPLHDRTVDFGVHEGAGRVASVRKRQCRSREARLKVPYLLAPAVCPVEGFPVVWLGIEKRRFSSLSVLQFAIPV